MRRELSAAAVGLLGVALLTPTPARAACRPDYENWTNHTFANDLDRLALGPGDRLWIGTNGGGVLEFDLLAESFAKHTRVGQCLPGNFIKDIAVNTTTGEVWVATEAGLGRRTPGLPPGDHWEIFDADNSPMATSNVRAVAVDDAGTVWIGTFDAGLYTFDGNEWNHFDTSNSDLSDNFVTSIEIDLLGDKWIGVWGNGVDRFDGTTWTNFNPSNTEPPFPCPNTCLQARSCRPERLGLISNFVNVLAVDPISGDIWFRNDDDGPCNGNGVTRFDGDFWATYTTDNSGLASDSVNGADVAGDGTAYFASPGGSSAFDGTVWTDFSSVGADDAAVAGTDVWWASHGLVRWDGSGFSAFTPNGLLDNVVADIEFDAQTTDVWAGTRGGLQYWDGNRWNTFDTSTLPSDDVRAVIRASNGDLWVGLSPGGAARWDGSAWTQWDNSDPGFCCSTITGLMEDAQNRIWAAWSLGGVSRWDGTQWTLITTNNSGLPSTSVRDMLRTSNDDLWFATALGASRLDTGDAWTTFTTADGLVDNRCQSLAERADGTIWIGTNQGISEFDGAVFTSHNGLGTDDARSMAVDAQDRVWASLHNTGAARLDGGVWTIYEVEDGLISNRFVFASSDDHPSGAIWLGTEFGISVFEAASAGPGSIPADASSGPPLTLQTGPGPDEITLDWGASCSAEATDYAVYRGTLGDFTSHQPVTCSTGGALSFTATKVAGDTYWLVTPIAGNEEGSYGLDSNGAERPASTGACAVFAPSGCP